MYCNHCGKKITGNNFCRYCGQRIVAVDEDETFQIQTEKINKAKKKQTLMKVIGTVIATLITVVMILYFVREEDECQHKINISQLDGTEFMEEPKRYILEKWDEYGNQICDTEYRVNCVMDEKNNRVKTIYFEDVKVIGNETIWSGTSSEYIIYMYDKDGVLEKKYQYSEKDNIDYSVVYSYNDQGMICDFYNEDRNLIYSEKYEYEFDKNGNVNILRLYRRDKGKEYTLIENREYLYNERNQVTQKSTFNAANDQIIGLVINEYDEKGEKTVCSEVRFSSCGNATLMSTIEY